jgi:tripartite ATP-independent transporter DctM subunit
MMIVSLVGFSVLLILAFLGIPLAFAMMAVGGLGLIYLRGSEAAISVSAQWIIETATNGNLSIIPLFILMGAFIHRSGISRELFAAANAWLGRFPGGLALAGIVSCAGFSTVCGSSLATAATMSKIALPSMRQFHYNAGFAAGTIAAGGTLGIMIPPSVALVVYGVMSGQDIGQLFIAGILPGILLVTLFVATSLLITLARPEFGPRGNVLSFQATIRASYSTWPVMVLFGIIIGGIYSGIFTPTEAAAVGCGGAFVFGVFRGHFFDVQELWDVFEETVSTTAMLFAILFAAMIFAQFLNLTGMPAQLLDLVIGSTLGPVGLVLMICLVCVALGTVFESIGILLLITPVFLPALGALGVDLIWFGILTVIVVELGLIIPPLGMNVYAVRTMAPDIPLEVIFKGVMPYVVAMFVAGLLILLFPGIATWLPSAMH